MMHLTHVSIFRVSGEFMLLVCDRPRHTFRITRKGNKPKGITFTGITDYSRLIFQYRVVLPLDTVMILVMRVSADA